MHIFALCIENHLLADYNVIKLLRQYYVLTLEDAMLNLTLTTEETDMLIFMLENCIQDLRMEISDTDNYDFKQTLKARKTLLNKILDAAQAARDGETPSPG